MNKLVAIRRRVLKNHPFFANLLFTFKFKNDSGVGSMQIDSDNRMIRYNPEWLNTSTSAEQEFMVCRLLMSIALKHHTRRGQRESQDWNMAAYHACLPYLQETSWYRANKMELEHGKLSAEQIYRIIHQEAPQMPQDGPGDENGDDDTSNNGGKSPRGLKMASDGQSEQDNNQRDQNNDDSDSSGQCDRGDPFDNDNPNDDNDPGDNGDPDKSGGNSGGGNKNDSKSNEQGQNKQIGEVLDGEPGKDKEAELDKLLQQSATLEKQLGIGKQSQDQHAEILAANHTHKICWKDILREYITESDKSDYNWIRPNRRYLDADVYLPARHATDTLNLTVAIDTSGSIDKPLFEVFWNEFTAICNEMSVSECRIIQCDAKVKRDDRYFEHDIPSTVTVKGRGGTEFKPVFELIEQDMARPNVLLYFTDLQVYKKDYPEHQPDYQTLWIVPDNTPDNYMKQCPFGQIIKIK